MHRAPLHSKEEQRLAALRGLAPSGLAEDKQLRHIVATAATYCRAPHAALSLVDDLAVRLSATIGLGSVELPRASAFCGHAILSARPFIVSNALNDLRFVDAPLVAAGPKVRAYVGVPLLADGGLPIGTLCLMYTEERTPRAEELQVLTVLARQAMLQLQATAEAQRANRLSAQVAGLEAQINEMQRQWVMTAKLSQLGEMAGNLAHEINNPLAVILGRSQQLVRQAHHSELEPGQTLAAAEAIEAMARRIIKISAGIRTFARDDTRDQHENVEVAGFFAETLQLCQPRFQHADIPLQVAPVHDDLIMRCQAVPLSQVVVNLLNNAYDAIQGLPERWVRLEARAASGGVEIAVTDSGGGIPEALRDQIMRPFFSTKRAGEGSGIGLSLAKKIVEDHGGTLQVDGSCKNTRFVFVVPRAAA